MDEILSTVEGRHGVPCGPGDSAQRAPGAWSVGPDPLLDETPDRFNGIEVMRVGRQVFHPRAAGFDAGPDLPGLVSREIVEHDDVAAAQPWCETASDPGDERAFVHGAPLRVEDHPTVTTDRPHQREIVTPVHRPRFDVFFAALDPDMRSAHRQVRAGFIEKHQPLRILTPLPSHERLALDHHVRPIDFTRARPFFLTTNPSRTRARWKLAGVVRWARRTRRLYSAHISAMVASGPSRTRMRRTATSIGECRPPPRGCGSTDSATRQRATHRSKVRGCTSNRAATWAYEPSPRSYASTARCRSATSYGFGMAPLKYSSTGDSSGNRD